MQRRDAAGAYDQALQALAAAEAVGTPEPLWRADMVVASLLHDRGDAGMAIFFGKQAVGQGEIGIPGQRQPQLLFSHVVTGLLQKKFGPFEMWVHSGLLSFRSRPF